MKLPSRASLASLLTCGLVMGLAALPNAAQAANLGEVCNLNQGTYIYAGGGPYYEPGGTPIRIETYDGPNYYTGHAEGRENGVLPRANINQATCHST
jgi:hypothetical protein